MLSFFVCGCLLHLANPAPLASVVLTVCCQRSEEQSVAEEEADSVPTGDVFSSNTNVSYVKEHSGALGRI